MSEPPKIGWVGAGIMGQPMAQRLHAAGYDVTVWSRRDRHDVGLRTVRSLAALVAARDVVITMLPGPPEVESVLLGVDGVLTLAAPGTLVIDMSTSSPALAVRAAKEAAVRDLEVLDAPVTGGPPGATSGTLSIMVGGTSGAYARALPLLLNLGAHVSHQGSAGAGQNLKLANQVMVASTMIAVAEARALLDVRQPAASDPLAALRHGIAGSPLMSWAWERIEAGDRNPGFKVDHLLKDLDLVLEEAAANGLGLKQVQLARDAYAEVARSVGGQFGTQSIVDVYPVGRRADQALNMQEVAGDS